MTELLVVEKRVKEALKASGHSVSADFAERLSQKVKVLMDDAIQRCNENGRKTVMAQDV